MSDIEIIVAGSLFIALVLGFIVWFFRSPKGVGQVENINENRSINSTTSIDVKSVANSTIIDP